MASLSRNTHPITLIHDFPSVPPKTQEHFYCFTYVAKISHICRVFKVIEFKIAEQNYIMFPNIIVRYVCNVNIEIFHTVFVGMFTIAYFSSIKFQDSTLSEPSVASWV